MKDQTVLVKLKRTLQNLQGDTMRKGSIVKAEKRYGGWELTKRRRQRKKYGLFIVSITKVKRHDFTFHKP